MKINGIKIRLIKDEIWIINLKCESALSTILRDNKQIFLCIVYIKLQSISINLNSKIDINLLFNLIKFGFKLVKKN